ncbi:hypothetical protein [Streptomyces sp. NPDC003943]
MLPQACTAPSFTAREWKAPAPVAHSFSTPALFGDRRGDFERDLRQALADHQPDGRFTETVRTEALAATRPA